MVNLFIRIKILEEGNALWAAARVKKEKPTLVSMKLVRNELEPGHWDILLYHDPETMSRMEVLRFCERYAFSTLPGYTSKQLEILE